eukprot:TRINITY_DN3130_c0_g1_i3.p2 TRINITY_DN3130_c0_g1~~TRINITY_DN3130_c0_g1_i3.p2  ORF type:complete len:232 (-),score=38.55 TRINITY_DN3130_c0_g1_i3:104-799(-)
MRIGKPQQGKRILYLPWEPSVTEMRLAPSSAKILVLDLDETLVRWPSPQAVYNSRMALPLLVPPLQVHTNVLVQRQPSAIMFSVEGTLFQLQVRPFLQLFLDQVSQWYRIVVYTSGHQRYADPIIDCIDARRVVERRFYRQNCLLVNAQYVKDLQLVSKELANVVLVDNNPASFHLHPDNGVRIVTWLGSASDRALLDVLPLLDALRRLSDVRAMLHSIRMLTETPKPNRA